MARLGVELGVSALRAVRLDGWPRPRASVVEVEWDPETPGEAVEALRAHLGRANGIAVVLDLPLLFVKRVTLPPVDAAERRKILLLEPERFFPVRGESVVAAVRADEDLVFAARESPLASWVAALETLGPVDLIEPGPIALARALARPEHTPTVVFLDHKRYGIGVVVVTDGRVVSARRLFGTLGDAAATVHADAEAPETLYLAPWSEHGEQAIHAVRPGATVRPLPALAGVAAPFLAAHAAALAIGRKPRATDTLLSPAHAARIAKRGRRAVAVASAVALAALAFMAAQADGWRARATRQLEAGVGALQRRAAPALAAQGELAALDREAQTIRRIERDQPDILGVLLTLSQRLPAGAYLQGLRWSGGEWQIEGYAASASRLVAALGATAPFRDLRLLSATTRITLRKRVYETFALAFRYAATP